VNWHRVATILLLSRDGATNEDVLVTFTEICDAITTSVYVYFLGRRVDRTG
jgi:hypothetical protein